MQYSQAKEIGLHICKQLEPFTTFCSIAGSVRREKADCGDLEIVCQPRVIQINDLFGEPIGVERLKQFCSTVRSLGLILKGNPETGRYVQINLINDFNLDLFIPQETDVWRQYAIRTGPREYSHKVLANAWLKKQWCGTDDGLRLQSECYQKVIGKDSSGNDKKKWICNLPKPTLPPVFASELELYAWLGVKWCEPSKRNL